MVARREQSVGKLFADAQSKAALGNEDDALRLLAQIDPQSRFFARARIRAKDLAQGLLRKHAKSCQAQAANGTHEAAARECALALDIKCQQQPVDADPLLKALRRAEASLPRRVRWSCPPELVPLFNDRLDTGAGAATAQQGMKVLYPNDKVRAAVELYARGELAAALRALSDPSIAHGPTGPVVAQAVEKIRLVDGRFREGQTSLLRGDLVRVDEAWGEALRADGALLPPGMDSLYSGQMRQSLSQAHAKAGDERLARGQYQSAFEEWTRGLQVAPNDPHLLDQLARLEKVAEGILGAAPTCDQMQTAARITRADPPSPAHKAALEALERCR
jgi:tetratricopeptide (TPR) repeat protein